MAIKDIAKITNPQYWDLARAASPTFKAHTAKATADMFTEKGFEMIPRSGLGGINDFFEITLRVVFQKVTAARAVDNLESSGLVEVYNEPYGGFIQRVATDSVLPIDPGFLDLETGETRDPFKILIPKSSERFAQHNDDYQALITIQPDEVKTVFTSQNGIGRYLAGFMQGLRNGRIKQNYLNVLEALNAGINSVSHPLQDTQKITLSSWGTGTGGNPTEGELKEFIRTLQIIQEAMQDAPSSSAFNAAGFDTYVDVDDFVILVREGILPSLRVDTLAGAFNKDELFLPWKPVIVKDFGGLIPYLLDGQEQVIQQPVYDSFGRVVGYLPKEGVTINGRASKRKSDGKWIVNITSGGATADTTIYEGQPLYQDPNEKVLAIVAQKGYVFRSVQNPYEVEVIRNPYGRYNNFFASSANNIVATDYNYNVVVLLKP